MQPDMLFVLKTALTLTDILWFFMIFRIFSFISVKNLSSILREIVLNLQITLLVMALLNFY